MAPSAFPSLSSRQRRERPLRTHLVTLVVLAVLPAIVFAAIVVALLGTQQRRLAERGLTDTARALASAVDREVNSSLTTLEAMATSEALDRGGLTEFHALASRVRASQRGWETVFLVTPSGEALLNTAASFGSTLPSVAGRPFLNEIAARQRPYVSPLVAEPVTARSIVTLAVPVKRGGALRYILAATFRPDTLNDLISEQALPGDWTATIIDQSLVIIARNRTPERFIGQPITAGLAGHVKREWDGSFSDTTKDGVPSFGVFSRTRLGNWIVVLALPTAALTAGANRWLSAIAIGGIACIGLGIGLALVAARRIARPVAELAGLAESVGEGTVPDRLPASTVAEVTQLGDALRDAAWLARQRSNERDESEAALRRSEERFRRVFEQGPLGMAIIGNDYRPIIVNPRLCEILGYAEVELTKLAFPEFTHPDDVDKDLPLATQVFRGEMPYYNIEKRYIRKDGEIVWVDLTVTVIRDHHGSVTAALALVQDITARHQAEEALRRETAALERARADAEAASHSKDEFLATLSHELRTPLNAVLGWAVMLRDRQVDRTTTDRAIDAIFRNARAQFQLIEDLLDTSRIVSGKLRLDVRPVDPITVVEAALDAVQPTATAREIRLERRLAPDTGPVTADPDRLQQVVWNLVTNAIKFTPRGGAVQVRLGRVESTVEIVVKDTGRGISETMLPHVFERFRQADSSSTRHHGGLGIGLALVKHLVELHGGSVTAESQGEGTGATFTVRFPALRDRDSAAEHATTLAGGDETSVRLDRLRVLLVDDQKETLDVYGSLFEHHGAEVRCAENTAEALMIFPEWRPHLLVSDIEMPGEDGYALIRKIRARAPDDGGRVPAVAVTAYASVEHRIRALAAGFEAYVAKPVEPAELIAVVSSLAARLDR